MDRITVSVVRWPDKRAELTAIRRAVFIEEQNVPESIELDDRDRNCSHVLASDELGNPIGTARIDGSGKIGRMAVLPEHRGRGVGTRMLEAIMEHGRSRGITDFHLSAQVSAVGFYRKMGFDAYGEQFQEAGITHINMRKR